MTLKITRVEKDGVRNYVYEKDGVQFSGTSVTTFLDLFKDQSWKTKYWYPSIAKTIENADFYTPEDLQELCKEKAEEVSKVATDHGTSQHEVVEKYRLGKCGINEIESQDLRKFLNISKDVECDNFKHSTELPVFYANDSIQIGGTLDDLLNVDCNFLYDKECDFELANERRNFIIDWKFPQYPKYGDQNLGYMVQLAIYRLALKFSYDLQIDDALIVMTPKFTDKNKVKLCKITYFYHLNKDRLEYFSQQFFRMVDAYNKNDYSLFDWNEFKSLTKTNNHLAERLYLT